MSPRQIIEAALQERFQDEDGDELSIALHPGLSEPEYAAFAAKFPVALPEEIEELLRFTRGFDFGPVERIDFRGEHEFEDAEVFPLGLPIGGDGCGNFWVVDVHPESGAWAPIFYACHDPPVIAWQAASLESFLEELFRLGRPGAASALNEVHEKAVFEIWRHNPGLIPALDARQSGDRELRAFAEQVEERALIADLRAGEIGRGFSWGRYGADTPIRRDGSRLLFAVTPPAPRERTGWLRRLLGR